MIVGGFETADNRGLLFAICTSVAFAVFAVLLRANRKLDMLPVLLVTGLFMAAVGGIGGSFSNAIPMSDIMLCLLWGMLLQGFAHSLMIRATRLILSAEITLFMLLEFTLNPLWVWLFINEVPTFTTLLGGGVIILSVGVLAGSEIRDAFKVKKDTI
jgi:drug/metabolite transporter (DMT)-like permease